MKYASAHDLRRSFGARWVMPQVPMELMRHESIESTLNLYVGRNTKSTIDVPWTAHEIAGNTLVRSDLKPDQEGTGDENANRPSSTSGQGRD